MLNAYFFAQGRVDAILQECDGEYMFIDSGYRSNGLKCVANMKAMGVTNIKYYCGSHSHKNHIGGAAPIIEAFKPVAAYVSRDIAKATILKYAKTQTEKNAIGGTPFITLKPGNTFTLGGADITCLGPLKIKNCSAGAQAENVNSLVLKVYYKGRTMQLTGDTSAAVLNNIHAKNEGCLRVEVLKTPHHNGALPLNTLNKIVPKIVVVCNGKPPSATYQKRVAGIGAPMYTAGKKKGAHGRVTLSTDGKEWRVQTTK